MSYQQVLAALADPTRREIFERLRRGPRPVGELAADLPVSRPAVSQHLRVLKEAGLVRGIPSGTRCIYSIDLRGLAELRTYLEGFWGKVLHASEAVAETDQGTMDHPKTEEKLTPVRKSLDVCCRVADAFRIFTKEIQTWWPLRTLSVSQKRARICAFEGRVGGQLHEEDEDGKRHAWGTVQAWDPPHRVVLTWHPGRDARTAQELELRFSPKGQGTRVELEHRGWESLGATAGRSREDYDRGWGKVLGLYAARTAASPKPENRNPTRMGTPKD